MAFAGDDDIMITRDGAMLRVKIIRMSQMEVVFIDLDHRRRGELKAPADYVFMIMKDKGNNICFDEKGNQTTQPARELEKKETYLFMNDGRYFPIYNLSIKKDELIYQLKDKKYGINHRLSVSDPKHDMTYYRTERKEKNCKYPRYQLLGYLILYHSGGIAFCRNKRPNTIRLP